MTALLLVWDPVWPEAWQPDYLEAAAIAADAGLFRAVWNVTSAGRGLEPGADAWFVVPGERAGLAGHGLVVSSMYGIADPQGAPDPRARLADIDIDVLLPLDELIALSDLPEEIIDARPEPGGAVLLTQFAGEELRRTWSRHGAVESCAGLLPGSLPQHAVRWSLTNRWENDADARRVCLAHHGPSCSACGFDPEAVFGPDGAGVLQVHHIVPPSLLQQTYALDPVTDLVPLCPTCHAVSHRGFPDPFTPAELRRLLASRRAPLHDAVLQGSLPSADQLRAQDDARKLLGFQSRQGDSAD
ncbi:restriction endonuclease [Arthrobacter gandavensis]|uniref:HNH endonuclease n=1 Tax=Arthrobacter gandavensis TaxID=169960 RepID=UPI00188F9365|nr:restriction endonuclease [Arthrobacter gandavensis]MBF4993463.1 restriction endonuclease [Arthrobacter gandavensis]